MAKLFGNDNNDDNAEAPNADTETGEIKPPLTETFGDEVVAPSAFAGVTFVENLPSSPEAIQAAIVSRVLKAGSLDELFKQWEGKPSDQLVGRTFEIRAVDWSRYEAENGPIPLARVDSIDLATKEPEEWVTTAPNLTAFLYRAAQLDALPFAAKIVSVKTKRGFDALHFERVEQ